MLCLKHEHKVTEHIKNPLSIIIQLTKYCTNFFSKLTKIKSSDICNTNIYPHSSIVNIKRQPYLSTTPHYSNYLAKSLFLY